MIRFLLDQGLPRSTTRVLAERGISAAHVGDLGMGAATDREIIAATVARESVLATLQGSRRKRRLNDMEDWDSVPPKQRPKEQSDVQSTDRSRRAPVDDEFDE